MSHSENCGCPPCQVMRLEKENDKLKDKVRRLKGENDRLKQALKSINISALEYEDYKIVDQALKETEQ
jgi:predicted nuclease with TOPRIM domain